MAYFTSIFDTWRRLATYVDRVLKGASVRFYLGRRNDEYFCSRRADCVAGLRGFELRNPCASDVWGVPDPAEAKGNPAEVALAFKDAYRMLHQRIGAALPIRSLDQLSLQSRLKEIGRMSGATAKAAEST
jgi:hypothetical protein